MPDILASQVAAGEVVERPASVVKELVENSVDAGAGEVLVDIERGGAGLIRVVDDGCGMVREDALMSFERHATSKLREASDLADIRTLGFRGEAVPSIASVAKVRMITRPVEEVAGTEIVVEGGRLVDVREAGCAPGTLTEVRSLFFNIPARRKFLKAESTEAAHIEHQVRMHALAAPRVRFRLRRDGRDLLDLAPVAEAGERVRQMIGTGLAAELLALPAMAGEGFAVSGFLLPAAHARKGRRHQQIFLNGRPVEDAAISRGLLDGYRGAVGEGLHPAAWLWIEMNPMLVDVNVHPAKREVRFHRPHELREVLREGVERALSVPRDRGREWVASLGVDGVDAVSDDAGPAVSGLPGTAGLERVLRSAQQEFPVVSAVPDGGVPVVAGGAGPVAGGVAGPAGLREPEASRVGAAAAVAGGHGLRVVGMLHGRFVILESADGLVLMDPKAAQERILYERLMREDGGGVQPLLVPLLLEFDPRDVDLLLSGRESLAEAGIEASSFGGNTIGVTALPADVGTGDPRVFLHGVLDEILHDPDAGRRFARERVARVLARRAAIEIVPRLAEAGPLLERLFSCSLPYCTADGRPTLTEYGMREISRRFGL